MIDDVTALFGMPGFQVLSAEKIDGQWHLGVETRRELVGCVECGAVATVKDRRLVTVRDLPAAGVPVLIRWRRRVFGCRHVLCPNRSWTEQHDAIALRAVLTERARQWAFEQVAHHERAVAAVAADLGVSWHTLMTQVIQRGTLLLDDPHRLPCVSAIGVDETAFLRATGKHPTLYVTGVADLTPGRPARLLDVVPGRSGRVLGGWLADRDEAWRAGIGAASLDPFRGYATALGAHLPDVTRVLDPLHVVKLALTCVDEVRRRGQQDTLGHRGSPPNRCSAPAGCCAAAPTDSPSSNEHGSPPPWKPATRTGRSPPPGSSPNNHGRPRQPPTWPPAAAQRSGPAPYRCQQRARC